MESGLAQAELELAAARARGLELRQSIVLRKREIAQTALVVTVPSVADPVTSVPNTAPELARAPKAERVPEHAVEPGPSGAAIPAPPRTQAVWLPLRWRAVLARLARCEPASLAKVISPNVVVRLGGEHPLSGMWLGTKQAVPRLEQLCAFVTPGTLVAEDIRSDEGTVEVTARVTLGAPSVTDLRLDTRFTAVIRYDDAGRVGLLSITPENDHLVDTFFRLAQESGTPT
jgi:ketosteroid isomerase-like protein